jgi:hypothetical protein
MEHTETLLEKLVANPFTRIPLFLGIVAGGFATIAAGFYATFQVVVFLGARM